MQILLTFMWADEPSWPQIEGDLSLYNIICCSSNSSEQLQPEWCQLQDEREAAVNDLINQSA